MFPEFTRNSKLRIGAGLYLDIAPELVVIEESWLPSAIIAPRLVPAKIRVVIPLACHQR
jgi:hypothetical protein